MKSKTTYLKEILYLLGKDKIKLPWMIFLFLCASLIDVIGIGLIGPYVSLIMNISSDNSQVIMRFIESTGILLSENEFLTASSVVLISIFLIKGVVGVLIFKMIIAFSYKRMVRIRLRLMSEYQSMSYEEYIARNSAEYIYAIQDLVSTFTGKVLRTGLKAISDIIVTISIVLVLAWKDIELLSILLLMVILSAVIYDRTISKRIQSYGKKANEASTRMIQGVSEGILGFKEIRVLNKSHYFNKLIGLESSNYSENLLKTDILTIIPRHLIEFIIIAFLAIMVIIEVLSGGNISEIVPTLAMFALASVKLIPSINSISTGILQLHTHRHTVAVLYEDFKKNRNVKEKKQIIKNNVEFTSFELSSIQYKYPSSKDFAIEEITFSIKRGEIIGVIGKSGSGKTTLVDVILGLLPPSGGEITLNDKVINNSMRIWQDMVAYIPQEVFVTDNTLRNNIALGEEVNNINQVKIDESILRSKLKSIVEKLPNKENTRLGENGISLSGGQKQRVSLARAIYHNREVLVMDEATSSLDEATEKEVVSEIKRLKGGITMLVVAHRYNTLKYCDRIYRLDDGHIVQELTYEELMADEESAK
jgi:ABC-type bacteriocin/lantibiotic exporter with double-glycine peptidase domain